eukprot:s2819_g3.t1
MSLAFGRWRWRQWSFFVAIAALVKAPVWLCGRALHSKASIQPVRAQSDNTEQSGDPWELLKALEGDVQWRQEEAARLLTRSALEVLSQWFQPAGPRLCVETSDNVDEALDALLEEGKPHVVDFLSDRQVPGIVSRIFWQAELYLRNFQQVAGEAPVEEFQQTAKLVEEEVAPQGSQMEAALEAVLARQQFVAACRFGYFLRRSQQRLRLERIMSLGPAKRDFGSIKYLTDMNAQEQVELVRGASHEVVSAAEARATDLFGTLAELLRGSELELSAEGRVRLSVEAVVFGAALFDAEATGSLMRACRNLCQAVVLTLLLRANAISEENEGNLTNATTTTQTTSTTYSVGTRTSSSTTCTWSTLTATATTQTHSTTSSTSTSTTTVHLVTMSGKILVDVSDPQAFSESAEVLIGLGRALHSILKVPMEAIKVTIETRPGSVQAVQYVVTLEGPTATEDMINAKQSLITATPQEIAQLFQQEVNALTSQTHLMMVMEVEPPRIEGIDDRGTTARGGYGMVFDPQVDSAHPLQSTLLAART